MAVTDGNVRIILVVTVIGNDFGSDYSNDSNSYKL